MQLKNTIWTFNIVYKMLQTSNISNIFHICDFNIFSFLTGFDDYNVLRQINLFYKKI
jgi:hypothetical protein